MRPLLRLAFAFVFVLAQATLAADWPQLLGPARNGASSETGLLDIWPDRGPPVLWEHAVGEGYSGPVVADGLVVLCHRSGNEEIVEGLEAATGKPRWRHTSPTTYVDQLGKGDGPRSTPAIAGGRVFALGAEGRLQALDLKTGKKIWSRHLPDDYEMRASFFGVGTSPLVEGDRVLVNVGARGAGLVAFAADSGKELWKATDQEASYSSPSAATIAGVRHVFFLTREGLVDVDPATGTVRATRRWRARMNASVNAATPLVMDDHLFLSASYSTGALLLRVRANGVEEVWQGDRSLSNHYNTSVAHGGHLYGIDGRQEEGARLRCVEWKTGKVRWSREGFGCAALILAEGRLLALTEGGELVLVDATADAYREKARAPVLKATPCRAEIALADGRLYARDGKKLVCWNLKK